MVKITVDEVYKQVSNFFELKVSTHGKIYKLPEGTVEGSYDHNCSVYDKTTGGKLLCLMLNKDCIEIPLNIDILKSFIIKHFGISLSRKDHVTQRDTSSFGNSYIAYCRSKEIPFADSDVCKVYDGFEYRVMKMDETLFLCVNPHLRLKFEKNIGDLIKMGLNAGNVEGMKVFYRNSEDKFCSGNIIQASADKCSIRNFEVETDEEIASGTVYLTSRPEIVQSVLSDLGRSSNIIQVQRQYSFLSQKEAAKHRFKKTLEIAEYLANDVFPLKFGEFVVDIVPETVSLRM